MVELAEQQALLFFSPLAIGDVAEDADCERLAVFRIADERRSNLDPDDAAILADVSLLDPVTAATAGPLLVEQALVLFHVLRVRDVENGSRLQFLGSVAGHDAELVVGTEQAAGAVRLGDPDKRRIVGRGKPRLAPPQRIFIRLAPRDSAEEAEEHPLPWNFGGCDRQLDGKLLPRWPKRADFDVAVHQRTLASGEVAFEAAVMLFAIAVRND